MAKQHGEREPTPTTPSPSAASPTDGMEEARALARRYLPDLVQLWAGIALGRDTEAGLHTRFLAGKAISDVAGVVPQATPTAPLFDGRSGSA
jgi:hypothetical protein